MGTKTQDELTDAMIRVLREVSVLATGIGAAAPDSSVEDRAAALIELMRLRTQLKSKLFKRRAIPKVGDQARVLGDGAPQFARQ